MIDYNPSESHDKHGRVEFDIGGYTFVNLGVYVGKTDNHLGTTSLFTSTFSRLFMESAGGGSFQREVPPPSQVG